jgi:hypothetical protein
VTQFWRRKLFERGTHALSFNRTGRLSFVLYPLLEPNSGLKYATPPECITWIVGYHVTRSSYDHLLIAIIINYDGHGKRLPRYLLKKILPTCYLRRCIGWRRCCRRTVECCGAAIEVESICWSQTVGATAVQHISTGKSVRTAATLRIHRRSQTIIAATERRVLLLHATAYTTSTTVGVYKAVFSARKHNQLHQPWDCLADTALRLVEWVKLM